MPLGKDIYSSLGEAIRVVLITFVALRCSTGQVMKKKKFDKREEIVFFYLIGLK